MAKTLSDKHKAVVDELIVNGFNRKAAYETVYKSKGNSSSVACFHMLRRPEVQEYLNHERSELVKSVAMDKQGVVLKLLQQIEGYDDLTVLASQESLTEKEYMKFNRLKELYSQQGALKAFEIIAKLTGLYEPEKVVVESVNYEIGFG